MMGTLYRTDGSQPRLLSEVCSLDGYRAATLGPIPGVRDSAMATLKRSLAARGKIRQHNMDHARKTLTYGCRREIPKHILTLH
jgi:hypothetical protein